MSFTPSVYVKMHTGDPGVGGTANAAANATRKQVTFSDTAVNTNIASSGGDDYGLVQDTPITYTTGEVTTTESYAWVSYWDAPTGGNWLANQDIPNQAATAGTALTIPAGTLVLSDKVDMDAALRSALFVERTNDRMSRNRRGSFRANAYSMQRDRFAKQNPQQI